MQLSVLTLLQPSPKHVLTMIACAITLAAGSVAVAQDVLTDESSTATDGSKEAGSAEGGEPTADEVVIAVDDTTAPADTVATATEEDDAPLPIRAALAVSTSVGIGTFADGVQRQPSVTTSFSPSLTYDIGNGMSLRTSIGGVWYQINDYSSALEEGRFLLTDLGLTFGHSSIASDKETGFNLSGQFSLSLPTSLASQYQNRILAISPRLAASWKVGPVTIATSVQFKKYFMTSSTPSINCEAYENETECIEGRGPDPTGGFVSEVRGGEVFIPSYGLSSFYVSYSPSVTWEMVEGLNLNLAVIAYHIFGVVSTEVDDLSSPNAKRGRNQTDRLLSSVSLSYAVHKNLGISLGLSTDTVRPYGADGKDFVFFDFSRASDNITSVSLGLTGSI